jgi:hypothetical protein
VIRQQRPNARILLGVGPSFTASQRGVERGDQITAVTTGVLNGPGQFLIDHVLHAFEPHSRGQLLVNDGAGLFKSHDLGRQATQALEALMDGRFTDAKVPRGFGLGVPLVEVGAEVGVGNFRTGHVLS